MIKQAFDTGWEYHEMQGMAAAAFAQWQPVTLPHDASISKPRSRSYPTGGGGGYAWSGVVTYRNKFHVPEEWKGMSVQLELEGVYMNAEVSVNGNLLALHPYGYTSFIVDLTPYLVYGADNTVMVVANNSAQPNSRWYTGTGIYRHVWLRLGGEVYIKPWGVFVSTPVVDRAASTVQVATELVAKAGSVEGAMIRTTILDANGATAAQVETPVAGTAGTVQHTLTVPNAKLWSVDEPNLYTLVSDVLVNGKAVDTERTAFGIRSIAVDAKNGFRLNGALMKLKGGCVHHDNGLLGAASYDRAEERKVELMKVAGFNAVRCAHNPPAPAFLDACDRLGMLVIDETFDCWRTGKNPSDYHLFFEGWWQRDTESMVKRDRNHPSVIIWSIGNEVPERTGVSDGYAWCRKQVAYVRSLDNTRPVTSAVPALFEEFLSSPSTDLNLENMFDVGNPVPTDPQKDRWGIVTRPFFASLDVGGYNYLNRRYEFDSRQFPERVICGTETFPHQAFSFWESTRRLPNAIGDFVWTALDYLGESGIGKTTFDAPVDLFSGQDPWPYHLATCGDIDICGFKRPQSYFRDILWGVRSEPWIAVLDPQLYGRKISFSPWGWEPVIDSWTFPGQEGKPTRVEIYCRDEEVELRINGVSAGRKPAGAVNQNKAVFDVVYEPGTIEAVGYAGGQVKEKASLETTSRPVALRLAPDRTTIDHEWGDLAYVTVEIVDAEGRVVKYADPEVVFEVAGTGDLVAVGAANPISEELYVGVSRHAYQGRLMAVVRSNGQPGEIALTARAEGLTSAHVRIQAQ